MINAPKKYVVSKRSKSQSGAHYLIRDNVIESIRALKDQPGRTSSQTEAASSSTR